MAASSQAARSSASGQGRWPDKREEPRGGLVFAEVADFQALTCGEAQRVENRTEPPARGSSWF